MSNDSEDDREFHAFAEELDSNSYGLIEYDHTFLLPIFFKFLYLPLLEKIS